MADETDPVLEELLRQQSPFQQFRRPPNPFDQKPVNPGTEADLDTVTGYVPPGVSRHPALPPERAEAKPSLLRRMFGWGKDAIPTPGPGEVAPAAPHGNMAQMREQFRQNPQGVAEYQRQALTDEGNRDSFGDRITHAPQRAFNLVAGVPEAVLGSGEHYANWQNHELGDFDPMAVAVPPQAAAAFIPGLAGSIARGEAASAAAGEGFRGSTVSRLEAWADKKGIPVPRDFQRPAAGEGLDRFSSVIQPKDINIWPGEENLTPGHPANKVDQNPLTPEAAKTRELLKGLSGQDYFPKPPEIAGIIDRLPGQMGDGAVRGADDAIRGRVPGLRAQPEAVENPAGRGANDASINHRVLKAESDNKVGALISTQDIMRQLEDLKLQGTPRVSGGGTTYIRVNDPINPDTPSLKVRVPPPDNLHGGKSNYREIDTSIEGTRHLHAGQTNAARQPYQGDIGRVRKALEFAFGRNLVSPGEEPGFTRYKTETQPPQPKELPNPDQMKLLARGDKHLMFGGSLGSHTEIGTKMPDADFWITRRGADGKLGEVSREYNPESFGVLNRNHQIDPDYLRYALEHVKNQGYYAGRGHGTTNLKNIRLKDVEDIPMQPSDFRLDAKSGDKKTAAMIGKSDQLKKAETAYDAGPYDFPVNDKAHLADVPFSSDRSAPKLPKHPDGRIDRAAADQNLKYSNAWRDPRNAEPPAIPDDIPGVSRAQELMKGKEGFHGIGSSSDNLDFRTHPSIEDQPRASAYWRANQAFNNAEPGESTLHSKSGDIKQLIAMTDPSKRQAAQKLLEGPLKDVSPYGIAKTLKAQLGMDEAETLKHLQGAASMYGNQPPVYGAYLEKQLGNVVQKMKDLPPPTPKIHPNNKWAQPENAAKFWKAYDDNAGNVADTAKALGFKDASRISHLARTTPRQTPQTPEAAAAVEARKKGAGLGGIEKTPEQQEAKRNYYREYQRAKRAGETPKTAQELRDEGKLNTGQPLYGRGEYAPSGKRILGPRPPRVSAAREVRTGNERTQAEQDARPEGIRKELYKDDGLEERNARDKAAVEKLFGSKDDTTLYARENKPWLPAETDKLRELHEKAALEGGNLGSIAKEMGRTTTTIWNRMQRLGLGRLNRGRFEGDGVPRDLFAGETRPTREQLNARDEAAVQRLFGKKPHGGD